MRVALHSVLKEGQEAGYEEVHATVPADLLEALGRAGITNWRIWRSGRHLFHLVDCEDFAAAMAALDQDPVNHRWQPPDRELAPEGELTNRLLAGLHRRLRRPLRDHGRHPGRALGRHGARAGVGAERAGGGHGEGVREGPNRRSILIPGASRPVFITP
ncbi:L-rhamnose mutarotase [Streptomyces sp. NPDC021225]|uniref:L-rhamnose mutarotase n=1 Tax=Streptomyces sp. NPDC021225 TaxID=3365121 RepID=UPI00379B8793